MDKLKKHSCIKVIALLLLFTMGFGQASAAGAVEINADLNEEVVDNALKYEGVSYKWGGTNPQSGFDCSGFVAYVFGLIGCVLPHSSRKLFNKDKKVTDYKQLHQGDLVFFSGSHVSDQIGHVGIVVNVNPGTGDFTFVHAAYSGVQVSSSTDSYYSKRLLCACRSPYSAQC